MTVHTTFGNSSAGMAGGKVTVVPPDAVHNGRFRNAFNMTPAQLYEVIGNGIPGAEVTVRMDSGGDAAIDILSRVNGKILFSADDNVFLMREGRLSVAQDRESEVRTPLKGAGFGKIFLDNMLALATSMGFKRVEMRAGREDGAWYWSYRGGHLDVRDAEDIRYERFVRTVRDNLAVITDENLKAQAEAVLAQPGADVNVRLAHIQGTVKERPAGAALLSNTNPMVVFNLQDAAQMRAVQGYLGDMAAARAGLRALLEPHMAGPAPVKAPSPLS